MYIYILLYRQLRRRLFYQLDPLLVVVVIDIEKRISKFTYEIRLLGNELISLNTSSIAKIWVFVENNENS